MLYIVQVHIEWLLQIFTKTRIYSVLNTNIAILLHLLRCELSDLKSELGTLLPNTCCI